MGRLGNHLGDEQTLAYVRACLVPGRVLLLPCAFTRPPKPKFLVFAGCDTEGRPLLLIINSQLSQYVQRHDWLRDCQVLLSADQYTFLDHDCYADCSAVVEEFTLAELETLLCSDLGRIKDELAADTKGEIVVTIQRASTVSRYHKRLIAGALTRQG